MACASVLRRILRCQFVPCLVLALASTAHGQLVLHDGDFTPSDWVSKIISDTGNMDSFTAVTESSGGNPGAYRRVTYMVQGGVLTAGHFPLNGSKLAYSPQQQGAIQAFSYTYDVKVVTGAVGLTYQFAVYQDGNTYTVQRKDKTDALTTWLSEPVSSKLTSSAYFTKIDGTGPMHPDFSTNGSTLYFGYVTSNQSGSTTCYPYCYYTSGSATLDTGIDNLTVNVFNGTPGVTCEATPHNLFLPFHRPECHILDPQNHPNHQLKVLVTSNGVPAAGASVTVSASTPSLSLGRMTPVSLSSVSLTTDANGQAVVYHSPPAPQAFDETDFSITGTFGSQNFTCTASAIAGIGALSGPLGEYFTASIASPQSSASSLRRIFEANRTLLGYVPRKPKYRAALKKIMRSETGQWTGSEMKTAISIAAEVGPHASPSARRTLANVVHQLGQALLLTEAEQRERQWRPFKPARTVARAPANPPTPAATVAADYGRLPLSFEANRGQLDPSVRYLARGRGFNLYLDQRGATLASSAPNFSSQAPQPVRIRFAGANPAPRLTPLETLPNKSNYLIGNDPHHWQTGIPNFARVKYERLYPGVDLLFYGREQHVEFDFLVKPGAQPGRVALTFSGAKSLEEDGSGGIILRHATGRLRLAKPVMYQEDAAGRHLIDGRYVVTARNRVGFQVARYDPTKTLVIDPIVSWASFLGGAQFDTGMAIAVDSQGSVYLAGSTASANFPLAKPAQASFVDTKLNVDSFVTKLNPAGTQLMYSTYVGGSQADSGMGIAVDSQGNAVVTGATMSSDFPLVNPVQKSFGGGEVRFPSDAFVFKLNSAGSSLVFSTYLGGSGDDAGKTITTDASGNIYVAGRSDSANFPLKNALQSALKGPSDAFVAELNPSGTSLLFSTLLGGHGDDLANGIAVDATGNIYLAGGTDSLDFPLQNAFQQQNRGSIDAFVAKLAPGASSLLYSTYLGGESDEYAMGIALDSQGDAYITGVTGSTIFPVQGAVQPTFGTAGTLGAHAFVSKLNPAGNKLLYSTYLGGSGIDVAFGIAVGSDGSAFVVGETSSSDFPASNGLQTAGGKDDGFVAKLKPDGSALVYSTLLGGSDQDSISGVVLDGTGNLYLAGSSYSADFPVSYGSYQTGNQGRMDAIVLRIADGTPPPAVTTVSAASFQRSAASESIVTGFGAGFADSPQQATTLPLPTELGTTSISVKDSLGSVQSALLFYVAPGQVNFLIPQGAAPGLAEVTVVKDGQTAASGTVNLGTIAPALFSANSSGKGVAAALAQIVKGSTQSFVPVFQCGPAAGSCVPAPLDVSDPSTAVYLTLYGTGIQGRSSLSNVTATLGGVSIPVLFAGPQGTYLGEDQVNLGPLPAGLAGKGEVELVLTVDGVAANTVTIGIQ